MHDFSGKVAVITGGGSGIGRGIALTLAREGMAVAVADVQSDAAESVASEIADAGGDGFAVTVDVTSVDSLSAAAAEVAERVGPVNLLCANAGVLRVASLDRHTIEDWEYTLSVNVVGVVKTVKTECKCVYAGTQQAHQRFQNLAIQQKLANQQEMTAELNQDAAMDWNGWGGWGSW